mmetsp:Transcript_117512/g.374448  ORF Transcript_117512/g.374448 Transcript_117512/m.374448 type:complete len:494 (+) Transcript_117512:69-1550(+)|eukprot:CAMPEP_0203845706 /NCGR_PEP_ID=MMETSP0359-20131031/3977_1 /ASSEMBLY_ACC=CAM_ASM_000338 /TAXON_ID=268821 /ORGANISM="Scrippsiella Hangoei, Strain SHTV-5" /LENGTH=493 /DNA_ID=CAMNT_0050760897 /DNA_START=109 /DNA_END=1590 /DNA_ORIENTATION=+
MACLLAFVLLAPTLLAPAASVEGAAPSALLWDDDECSGGEGAEGACALNALQLRGVKEAQVRRHGQGPDLAAEGNSTTRLPETDGMPESDEDLGSFPLWHYARNCWQACGKSGFCEDYCGPGNACCNYFTRDGVRECELARTFPMILPNYWTCVETTAAAPSTPAPALCEDASTSCAAWASKGECDNNPVYMSAECCRSCQSPGGPSTTPSTTATPASTTAVGAVVGACQDSMDSCPVWAGRGYCVDHAEFMATNCCASCRGAGGGGSVQPTPAPSSSTTEPPTPAPPAVSCEDSSATCSAWAARGECEDNSVWMNQNCKLSCKVCSGTATAPPIAVDDSTTTEAMELTTTKELMTSTMTPIFPTADCHTAVADDARDQICYDAVRWVFTDGLYQHPEWYVGLTPSSDFEAAQYKVHQDHATQCPMPCAPTPEGCTTAVSGSSCWDSITFARTDGIYSHPEWFPELQPTSSIADFQMHLHNSNTTVCPWPCMD